MKKVISLFFICFVVVFVPNHLFSQTDELTTQEFSSGKTFQPNYVADPNHREIVLKFFELAVAAGFSDTLNITPQEIKDRLEAGAYSEDIESIPGIIGSWQTLIVYDVLGNEVATFVDEYKPAGSYQVEWNASNCPSRVYFYQLKTENFIETKKMILMK